MATQDFLLDKRVVYRNIAKGLVDKKTLEKHLSSLPDVESNSEPCVLDVPEADDAAEESDG